MAAGQSSRSPTVRMTQSGPVEGVDDAARSRTYRWLGVPFARPPIGALRWKPPLDPEPWVSPRPAKMFASASAQCGMPIGPGANNTYDVTIASTIGRVVGSEDCLYLNMWRPANDETGLPVIVFIHGGYLLAGYTADPMYDGANLAREANAVVVTVNYRLGVLGWLNLPQLKTGDPDGDSGNFGMLDIIQALRWVHRNIAEFGGDAGNVTVMGQSAGAVAAWLLLVARATRNARLFHRLVPISGGMSLATNLPSGSIPILLPTTYFAAQGKALLQALLIADGKAADAASADAYIQAQGNAHVADYLRSKPADEILSTVVTKLTSMGLAVSWPIPDGHVLPLDPIASIVAGDYASVPVLAGSTREEGKILSQLLALSPALGGVPGLRIGDAERFMNYYNFDPDGPTSLTVEAIVNPQYLPVDAPDTGFNARTALLTKVFLTANSENVLNALKTRQPDVWHYRFDWAREAPPYDVIIGAGHLVDMLFVFGNFGPSLLSKPIASSANRKGRLALSKAMMASVAAFARAGDPNNDSLGIAWPTWPRSLVFDASLDDKAISVI